MDSLVSIISPCYNGESFIGRFIESIYRQTYNHIEFIIINDGSTDGTEEIILSYKQKFIDRGYSFIYIYQQNAGQSATINQGLKIFNGEYLTWLDSDDYLPKDAISLKVNYLNHNKQVGTLISRTLVIDSDIFRPILIAQRKKKNRTRNLFFDLIDDHNGYCLCGGYMVRTNMFKAAMPSPLRIQTPKEIGQNFQLLLPILYKYPYLYVDDILYYYFIRTDSHSHRQLSYEAKAKKIEISNQLLLNIANDIEKDVVRHKQIVQHIETRKLSNEFMLECEYANREKAKQLKSALKGRNSYNRKMRFVYLKIKCPILYSTCNIFIKIGHKIITYYNRLLLKKLIPYNEYLNIDSTSAC